MTYERKLEKENERLERENAVLRRREDRAAKRNDRDQDRALRRAGRRPCPDWGAPIDKTTTKRKTR